MITLFFDDNRHRIVRLPAYVRNIKQSISHADYTTISNNLLKNLLMYPSIKLVSYIVDDSDWQSICRCEYADEVKAPIKFNVIIRHSKRDSLAISFYLQLKACINPRHMRYGISIGYGDIEDRIIGTNYITRQEFGEIIYDRYEKFYKSTQGTSTLENDERRQPTTLYGLLSRTYLESSNFQNILKSRSTFKEILKDIILLYHDKLFKAEVLSIK